MENKAYYFYVLYCADNTFYGGYSDDVLKRFETHEAGKGAKYTRARLPVRIVYQEMLPDKSTALKREAAIKKLTRVKKLNLINKK